MSHNFWHWIGRAGHAAFWWAQGDVSWGGNGNRELPFRWEHWASGAGHALAVSVG